MDNRAGKRVLVVDDDDLVRRALLRTLRALVDSVLEGFSSGREALERFDEEPFDIAVLDIQMPSMSGVDLARELRKRRPDMPVVFLTGHAPEALRKEALALLPRALLEKPWDDASLLAALK